VTENQPQPAEADLRDAVADEIAAQAKEYGTYVATQPINVGNARAYNEGDPVPVSNVERYHYDELGWVKRV
jgi:hypothetical protein